MNLQVDVGLARIGETRRDLALGLNGRPRVCYKCRIVPEDRLLGEYNTL